MTGSVPRGVSAKARLSVQPADALLLAELQELRTSLTHTAAELSRELREKTAIAARLAMILDSLPNAVVVVDAEGVVRQLSRPAQTVTDLSPGEPWASFCDRLLPTPSPELFWHGDRMLRVTESLTPAGESLFTLTDITEGAARRAAEERDRQLIGLGLFASHLSHQLRTPLSAAILYAGLLTQRNLNEAKRLMYAETALGRLNHLQDLITNARDHLGVEPASPPESFGITCLVGDLAPALRGLAQRAGVDLQLEMPAGCGGMSGWRVPLEGALTNLVDNAIKHSPQGGCISLEVQPGVEEVAFVVEDDGPGIAEELRGKIFEPFFTERPGGTGLGLAIVRGVAERHGGRVEAQAGSRGARIVLTLPRIPTFYRAEAAPAATPESR